MSLQRISLFFSYLLLLQKRKVHLVLSVLNHAGRGKGVCAPKIVSNNMLQRGQAPDELNPCTFEALIERYCSVLARRGETTMAKSGWNALSSAVPDIGNGDILNVNYLPGCNPSVVTQLLLCTGSVKLGVKGLNDFLSKHVIYFVIQNKTKKKRIKLDSIMYD